MKREEIIKIIDKTLKDFFECEGGQGWMRIDGEEYNTDVGYALEGMEIFAKVLKKRLTESREQGMTKEEFKAKAKAVIDNEKFGGLGALFDYESFDEMRVAYIPDDLGSAEADMPLDDFLDKLYEQIKGDLK